MKPSREFPIRFAVCESVAEASRLVNELRVAGFTAEEISVVCSQEACELELAPYIHEHPAGSKTQDALNKSGLAALGLGSAAILAGLATTAGAAIMVVGAFSGLAIAGTFVAVMMTRGAEKELADYYDQALTHGKILVGVETSEPRLQTIADEILQHEGRPSSALPKASAD
ncbi:MAG: hypothetical protein KF861_10580 [Planctomycetaceae bacterium]|nr:hypothetical protein [Planctomycetaceae bacterium]